MSSKQISVWAAVNISSPPVMDKLGTVIINDFDKKSDDEIEREALDIVVKSMGFENIDEYHKLMPATSLRVTSEFTTDVFFDCSKPQINWTKVGRKKGSRKSVRNKPITISDPSANDETSISVKCMLTVIAIFAFGLTIAFIFPTYSIYSIFGFSTSVLKVILTAFIFSTVATIVLLLYKTKF